MCTYVAFVQVHLVCLLMVLHACALTCDPVASGSGLLPLHVIIQSISHSPNKPTDRHSIDQTENFVRMYLCLEEYCVALFPKTDICLFIFPYLWGLLFMCRPSIRLSSTQSIPHPPHALSHMNARSVNQL